MVFAPSDANVLTPFDQVLVLDPALAKLRVEESVTSNRELALEGIVPSLETQVVSESAFSAAHHYFHGSPFKFQKFSEPKGGRNYGVGIYLTQDREEAIQYSLASDEDGWLYTVKPSVSRVFDVHSKTDADKIRREMERQGFKFVVSRQYDFENEEMWGSEPWDHQNWYWRLVSMLGRNGVELDKEIFTWFDAILDSKKKWLVIRDPKKAKIIKADRVILDEYEFVGPIGHRKFSKK